MSLSLQRLASLNRTMAAPSWLARYTHTGSVAWSLVVGTVAVCAIGNIFWLTHHFLTIPPPWDQAFYLYMGLRYFHALADSGLRAMITEFVQLSPDVAPLYPLTAVPLYLLFGASRLVAHLTNLVYLFLLLGGVYLLGAHIYGRKAGMLAVFVMATFTAVVNYSRDYLLEFPATTFVTLAMYSFVRAAEFRHRPWGLAFGILAGFSLLTKTMSGVFFIGPALYALGRLLKQRQLSTGVLSNAVLSVGVGMAVASVWWGPNFRTAFGYLVFYGFQEGAVHYSGGGSAIFTAKNLSYYALALINHGTSFLYASLLAVLMLIHGIKRLCGVWHNPRAHHVSGQEEWYLWAWLLVGYAILTLVPNKGEERYAQPLLPPLALILAGSLQTIPRRWMRRLVVLMVVAIGGVNYLGLTYGLPLIPPRFYAGPFAIVSHEYPHYTWVRSKIHEPPEGGWKISAILFVLADLYSRQRASMEAELRAQLPDRATEAALGEQLRLMYGFLLLRAPNPREVQKYTQALRRGELTYDGMLENLRASREFKAQRANVLVVPDHPQFNASTLRYYAEVERLPLRFSHILDGPIATERLQMYEFILAKQGGFQGPEFSTRYTDEIQAMLGQPTSTFVALPESFVFPDESHIVTFVARSVLSSARPWRGMGVAPPQ
jgi:hypothetical protein